MKKMLLTSGYRIGEQIIKKIADICTEQGYQELQDRNGVAIDNQRQIVAHYFCGIQIGGTIEELLISNSVEPSQVINELIVVGTIHNQAIDAWYVNVCLIKLNSSIITEIHSVLTNINETEVIKTLRDVLKNEYEFHL